MKRLFFVRLLRVISILLFVFFSFIIVDLMLGDNLLFEIKDELIHNRLFTGILILLWIVLALTIAACTEVIKVLRILKKQKDCYDCGSPLSYSNSYISEASFLSSRKVLVCKNCFEHTYFPK